MPFAMLKRGLLTDLFRQIISKILIILFNRPIDKIMFYLNQLINLQINDVAYF